MRCNNTCKVIVVIVVLLLIIIPLGLKKGFWGEKKMAATTAKSYTENLYIVGPGGAFDGLKECADAFSKQRNVGVEVVLGPPDTWANKKADLVYGGAPYMLTNFNASHPGVIDLGSECQLYSRQIGIIVRKGNPMGITSLADLGRKDINVLDVKLENMGEFQKQVPSINIATSVTTGQQGLTTWRSMDELNAWITYKTWYLAAKDETEFIPLPGKAALRPTPIAITTWTKHRKLAQDFITFLQTEQAHAIFQKCGWE